MNNANCTTNTAIRPRVDVHETDNGITLEAELPGVSKEHAKVEYTDGKLVIEGTRPKVEGDSQWHLRERPGADFYRAFELGDTLDTQAIKATMVDGVLTVQVTRKAEHAPRKIPIN